MSASGNEVRVAGEKRKPETVESSEGCVGEKFRKEKESFHAIGILNFSVPLHEVGFILNEVHKRYVSLTSEDTYTRTTAVNDLRISFNAWKAGTWVLVVHNDDAEIHLVRSKTAWAIRFSVGPRYLLIVTDIEKTITDREVCTGAKTE